MHYTKKTRFKVSAGELFAWHERPGAFERLNPPFDTVTVLKKSDNIKNGARVLIQLRRGLFKIRWLLEHYDYIRDQQFRDRQISGPFTKWEHFHKFHPAGSNNCVLEDEIEYILPLGSAGSFIAGSLFKKKLDTLFSFRHRRTSQDIMLHKKYKSVKPLKILIAGSHGLVGSALIPFLTTGGHLIFRLQRNSARKSDTIFYWDPDTQKVNPEDLEGFDVVIHLGGVNIGSGLWTRRRKKLITESRVATTRFLSQTISSLKSPPRIFIVASATGFYGNRGNEQLTESNAAGSGFLADLTTDWETATSPAREAGIRVVNLRFGLILSPEGGVLSRLIPLFKMGLGTVLGAGRQYWPWIAIDDVIGAIFHIIHTDEIHGPVNVVSPNEVTNREFTRTLNRILRRPTLFSVPSWLLKIILGGMADEMFLASSRVKPQKLINTGYSFLYPDLEQGIRFLLGKRKLKIQG